MLQKQRTLATGAWLGLTIAAFIAVNVLSGALLRNARIDLTAEGLYTLSDSTQHVLDNLAEPISLRLFFSEQLSRDIPPIRDYERRVRELLEQYVASSDGLIELERIDPVPFSDEEDLAVVYDLQGVPISSAGERLYLGLVATNSTDDTERVPFFERERETFLEYDLTRIIYDLANPRRVKVGLVTSLPVAGGLPTEESAPTDYVPPWAIHGQLLQLFDVENLGPAPTEIGDDIDILMVVHPKEPKPELLYLIDQFVMSGRGAIFFVDPFSEIEFSYIDPQQRRIYIPYSNISDLFQPWGFELAPGEVVADRLAARKVSLGGGQVVDYVLWLALLNPSFSKDDVITANLERLFMHSSGWLRPTEENPAPGFTSLVRASPQSMSVERFRIQVQPDPTQLLADFVADTEVRVLAARVTGALPSAFPDGPPGDADTGEDPAAAPAGHRAAADTAHLIVVADSDILADNVWVATREFFGRASSVPTADNGSFVINALESLAGGGELIGLRSRGSSVRPFTVVQDLEREAETRYRETERALQGQLQEPENKLRELQGAVSQEAEQGAPILTAEQRETIAEFREQIVTIRKRLRDVQYELRSDIDALSARLEALNSYVMPMLVVIAALIVPVVRRRRRQSR